MELHSNRGIKKVLSKLENAINDGNYYEAHQMYRTLYFRYLGQRRYFDLIHLLYNGSLLLLQQGQHTSGADLGILLVDVLKKSEIEPTKIYFEKITDLFALMSPSPERLTFIQHAIRWSMSGLYHKTGHPDFHQKLAKIYWNEKNYSSARQHFLHTKSGCECASMLVELHGQQGYANEIDFFVTQTVLQFLCLQNKAAAIETFQLYIRQHPRIQDGPPFFLPLLNFLFFLLQTIDSGKHSIFKTLCEQYFGFLAKDPSFLQYLDKIGQLFFNIQPSENYNTGLLSSFLQSFFNGFEGDINEDQQASSSHSHLTPELD